MKIKRIINPLIFASVAVATPLVSISCTNNKKHSLALVSDSPDVFKFSKEDTTMEDGKLFQIDIVQDQTYLIESIFICSADKFLEEGVDFYVSYNDIKTQASITIFKPHDDLFVILTSNNSDIISPMYTDPIKMYPSSGRNRDIILRYYDLDLPDADSLNCAIVYCDNPEISLSDISLGEIEYDYRYNIIHVPLVSNFSSELTKEIDCNIKLKLSYSIWGVPLHRYIDIPVNFMPGEYALLDIDETEHQDRTIEVDSTASEATVKFKFDSSLVEWKPLLNRIFGNEIIITEATRQNTTINFNETDFEITDDAFTLNLAFTNLNSSDTATFDIRFGYFISIYEFEEFTVRDITLKRASS